MTVDFDKKPIPGILGGITPSKARTMQKSFYPIDFRTLEAMKQMGWYEDLKRGVPEEIRNLNIDSILGGDTDILAQAKTFKEYFAIDTSLLDSINLTLGEQKQMNREQFTGFFLDKLENVIGIDVPKTMQQQVQTHADTSNLKENLNPIGVADFFKLDDIIDILTSPDETPEQKDAKKKEVDDNTDRVLKQIYQFNVEIISLTKSYDIRKLIEQIQAYSVDNKKDFVNNLKVRMKDILLIFNTVKIVDFNNNRNLFDQMENIKDIFKIISTDLKRLIAEKDIDNDELSSFLDNCSALYFKINDFMNADKQYLKGMEMDYRDIDPTKVKYNDVSDLKFNINNLLFVAKEKFNLIFDRFFENVRESYRENGLSSVNQEAQDYIKKGKTRKDVIQDAEELVPTVEMAKPYTGVGERIAEDSNIESLTPKENQVGPFIDDNLQALLDCMVGTGADYGTINDIGALGRYSFGAKHLIQFGYVKPTTTTSNMAQPNNWTGKDGIKSREDFLANKDLQEKLIRKMICIISKKLLEQKVMEKGSPISTQGALICTAFKFGTSVAKKIEAGEDMESFSGLSAKKTYEDVKKAISDEIPKTEVTESMKEIGASEADQIASLTTSSTIPDAPVQYYPVETSGSRYPFNKVHETESGHFFEQDDTPGGERVNFRHRTGAGFEIGPDGSAKYFAPGNRYVATLGDDYTTISGSSSIVVTGDVNIKASGTMNLNAGSDMNFVVGGDVNWEISGNESKSVAGNSNVGIEGDSNENVSGFKSTGVEGDIQIEGASFTAITRTEDINLISPQDIALRCRTITGAVSEDINLGVGDNINITTDNVNVIASETIGLMAGEGIFLQTKNLALVGGTAIDITGSVINGRIRSALNSEFAYRANQSNLAGGIGGSGGSPVITNLPNIDLPSDTDNGSKGEFERSKDSNFIGNLKIFEAIDTSKTQANNSGTKSGYFNISGSNIK